MMEARAFRRKKSSSIQSKHRDPHWSRLHRETNDYIRIQT